MKADWTAASMVVYWAACWAVAKDISSVDVMVLSLDKMTVVCLADMMASTRS